MRRISRALAEVASPILPVAALITLLQLVVVRAPVYLFIRFAFGVVLVILGFSLFLLGVRVGLLRAGEHVGANLPARVRVWVLLVVVGVLGFVATIAEPDVRVLGRAVEEVSAGSLDANVFILVVSLALGVALAGAILRQMTNVRLAVVIGLGYGLVLAVLPFVSPNFLALAFDAGSTTTGSLSVPLILALGLGVARTVVGRNTLADGFGLVGLASLGPVVVLALMGLFA